MTARLESPPQLDDLSDLELSRIGCACDLLWLEFGHLREVLDRKGDSKLVGELALHVNVPWRISDGSGILIGNRDLYFYADGESYDFDRGGDSRFHIFADAFNTTLESSRYTVRSVGTDVAGGLVLQLTGDYTFAAFPNVAHSSPGFEFWRLFAPNSDTPHLVRETQDGG